MPQATGGFSSLLHHIGIAAKKINREVNKAGLVDILGRAGTENVQGEDQQKLDVYIRRLREKIEEDPSSPGHLVTIRGLGYCWE